MTLLFVLALLLAWPTYGVSLILWLGIVFINAGNKSAKVDARREKVLLLEPIFGDRQADYFNALEVPLKPTVNAISHNDAHECGRHIMNYVAHNPDELQTFVHGLKRWAREDGQMCHPVTGLEIERRLGSRGDLHKVSLRAIQAIVTQNPNLQCFKSIDLFRLEVKHPEILGQ